MQHPIYTVGYSAPGWTPELLHAEVLRLGAVLWDVRFSPYSRIPGWSREALIRTFGDQYRWARNLGNRNYQGGPIDLHRPAAAVAPFLAEARPVVLLCVCQDHHTCHRTTAAAYLAATTTTAAPIIHLKAPAPAPAHGLFAITVRQPWAWAIMRLGKDIENRSWKRSFRGRLAIHAAGTMTRKEYDEAWHFVRANLGLTLMEPKSFVYAKGAILGTAEVVDWVDAHASPWFVGEYGAVLRNPQSLAVPISCSGALGLWSVPAAIVDQINKEIS